MSVFGWLGRALSGAAARRVEQPGDKATLPHVVIAQMPPVLTPDLLMRAVPLLSAERAAIWCPAIVSIVTDAQLGPRRRMAMFLAHTGHETGSFVRLRESLDYSPGRLVALWPRRFSQADADRMGRTASRPADQRGIAERAYGGRMGNIHAGDGWTFRGGGPAQLTGRENYTRCATALGMDLDALVRRIEEPEIGMRSAAWFWRTRAGLIEAADAGDVERATKLWNGGDNGLEDRRRRYALALEALGG